MTGETPRKKTGLFSIKGQVYHKVGSLLSLLNESHKLLQGLFISEEQTKVDQLFANISELKWEIIEDFRGFYQNQKKFYTEEYIQFRDTIVNDVKVNDIGRLVNQTSRKFLSEIVNSGLREKEKGIEEEAITKVNMENI
ncbi:hypothetical protein CEXT_590281 [Caerostris extrusa]|uniref:Uncharacterized protein n=1 Tax=Caerostris extrusa TaxID=172846 RepID=A0AAV4WMT0_CAEEX|nr:hypothetical protein CEXT_590281 [Caerostris extrusa]